MWDSRKAGKRGRLETPYLLTPLATGLPEPTSPFDYAQGVSFGMCGNNVYGDCTIAGVIHLLQVAYNSIGKVYTPPSDSEIENEYFTLSGGQDTGLDVTSVLQTWSHDGLFGTKIDSFYEVDITNPQDVINAIYTFSALYLAVDLPQSAETDFENHLIWSDAGDQPIGGHCIVASGARNNLIDLITWGAETECTQNWFNAYTFKAYGVVPDIFIEVGHGPIANFNFSELTQLSA